MNIAEKNIEAHTIILEKIRDGAQHGKFNKGDLAQVISRVARAKANFESVKQSLTEAESAYHNLVGIAPDTFLATPVFPNDALPNTVAELIEQAKKEIMESEKAFAALALEKGVEEAFATFIAEDGAIVRNNSVIV